MDAELKRLAAAIEKKKLEKIEKMRQELAQFNLNVIEVPTIHMASESENQPRFISSPKCSPVQQDSPPNAHQYNSASAPSGNTVKSPSS